VLVVPLQPVWVWVSGRWPAWPVTKTFRSSSSLAPTYTKVLSYFRQSQNVAREKLCEAHSYKKCVRKMFELNLNLFISDSVWFT